MRKSGMNPKVDAFLHRATAWQEEFEKLRAIALACPLDEDLKWGTPCYSLGGGNVVLIHGFKDYCALLFFKGALLQDPEGILVQQTKNVQATRQIRFSSLRQIVEMEPVITAYIEAAIEVEKAGLKVALKSTEAFEVAEEFQARLDELPALKAAFEALTPGRQRAYLLHFAAPKQSRTRSSRIEKCIPLILEGRGLQDR
ncbi:MAG: YdeI family protein [Rhodothermales bacterium]